MVRLAVVVPAEKLWVHGELPARAVGIAALALAAAAIWVPSLAPGLHSTSQMMDMTGPCPRTPRATGAFSGSKGGRGRNAWVGGSISAMARAGYRRGGSSRRAPRCR